MVSYCNPMKHNFDNITIIIMQQSRSWTTCWPIPVSHIQRSLEWSYLVPSDFCISFWRSIMIQSQ
jgi:hypothetical protein